MSRTIRDPYAGNWDGADGRRTSATRRAVRTGTFVRPIAIQGSARPVAAETPSGKTIPGTRQDPLIHLMSATVGKSPLSYHDVIDFLSRDTIEEEVVAGAHEGKQSLYNLALSPNSKQLLCPNHP